MARQAKYVDKNPDNQKLDFDSAVDMFLADRRLRGLTKRSLGFYTDCYRYLKQHSFPSNLIMCTQEDVEKAISDMLQSRQMKPVTVNGKIRAIKALFNFLYERSLLQRNPAKGIRFIKHDKAIIKTFESRHIKALLRECADGSFVGVRDHAIILLLLDSGIRVGELLSMHLPQLDAEHSSAIVIGKARKARRVYYSPETASAISTYLLERGELDHTWMWVAEDNCPLKTRSLQDRLHDLGKRAGITDVRCSPHTFRHTAAKMCIQNGMDIFTLQKMLGHSSLEMVRNYVEMFDDEIADAHAKFSPVQSLR
jgi:integrase/recombinase XerD